MEGTLGPGQLGLAGTAESGWPAAVTRSRFWSPLSPDSHSTEKTESELPEGPPPNEGK
jgi:hypothetical protein